MRPRSTRLRTLLKPLAFVLLTGAILIRRHRRRVRILRGARPDLAPELRTDPTDPVQSFDEVSELQVMPLEVDAQSHVDVEAAQDLAGLESEIDEIAGDDDAMIGGSRPETGSWSDADEVIEPVGEFDEPTGRRDAGDLYGAHTPTAADRLHPDDDRAFDEGQNWIEALETSAIENGAEPERELDEIIDDEDVLRPPHPSDTRDRPVADHGSGGRRGL